MKLDATTRNEALLITVDEPRIDAAVAIHFKDRMRALTDGAKDRVVLDLSRVEFLDSSGLGAVVAAMKQMGPGRQLELAGLTPTVSKVFRLTRMDKVFAIHSEVDSAFDGVARAS